MPNLVAVISRYPNRLAYQIRLPRRVLRKHALLNNLHNFLVTESELVTECKDTSMLIDSCVYNKCRVTWAGKKLSAWYHRSCWTSTRPAGFSTCALRRAAKRLSWLRCCTKGAPTKYPVIESVGRREGSQVSLFKLDSFWRTTKTTNAATCWCTNPWSASTALAVWWSTATPRAFPTPEFWMYKITVYVAVQF